MGRDYFQLLATAEPQLFAGIPEDQARKIWEAGRSLTRNQMLLKASEMLTRPKTHPTKAILETLQYAGFEIPPGHSFEEMEEDLRLQSAWLFEGKERRAATTAEPENPAS